MLVRWLVNSYVRQTAQRKLYEVMGEALRGGPAPASAEASDAPDDVAGEPPPPCAAAVVFGSDLEAGGLIDSLSRPRATRGASFTDFDGRRGERRIVVVETGVGREAARRGADDAIRYLSPQWVISAGFAAALDERVRRGSFLMADSVMDEAGQELAVGFRVDPATAPRGVHVGRLLTVDRLVRDEAQRRELGTKHAALACDMETMAVAEACRAARVRFMAVRVVTEGVDERMSQEIERWLKQGTWAGKLGVAAAALMQRPAIVKEFWKLREDAIQASDRLARFLGGVLDQLP